MDKTLIVVGAGVIGCSLAYELTQRGASVTVIDAAEAGSGTSAATFAWVNSNNKTPEEYHRLNVLGLQAHERSARSFSRGARWFHQIGTVDIAQTDQQMAALKKKVSQLTSRDYAAELLTEDDVRQLEPSLQITTPLAGGALYSKEGWLDVQKMCLTLLDQVIDAGATFAPYQTVVDIQPGEVTTTSGGSTQRHQGDTVILAAGNGTREILAHAGINFPTIDPAPTSTLPGHLEPASGSSVQQRRLIPASPIWSAPKASC